MIHTIGHSNHPLERFTALLRQHGITALADVRSTPHSRFHPQFIRARLQSALAAEGLQYVFLGEQLGARTRDPDCFDADGRVSYAKLAATPVFRRGLERLREIMQTERLALMCAEREPLDCHRTILISRELAREGIPVTHILADGSLEAQEAAMRRLGARLGLPDGDLFTNAGTLAEQACDLQAARIAWRGSTSPPR